MAVLQFLSAVVLLSAISVAATDTDKKGYEVTTALDGNKLGIAFYHVYEDTNGGPSVVALDSTKSSIHRLSLPLSQSSVVEHISGGTPGYRDGSTEKALFNHPKKLTVDSDGTIYVADTKNAAVRMITREGRVATIAGGSNRTGHDDGEGIEVTFSNDFDVTYLRSTCSLAVADRGNRLIREIQLPQFIGRCGGATPNSPGSTFTSAALLMSLLAGVFGTVAGAILTILTMSARRLEQLQSKLCWVNSLSPLYIVLI
jgi:hypothetical protein